jgi:uncharacterized protein involved in response to NO
MRGAPGPSFLAISFPAVILLLVGFCIFDAGGGVFFFLQVLPWFETAVWRPISARDVLLEIGYAFTGTQFLGLNEIINWFLDRSGVISLFFVGALTMLVGGVLKSFDVAITEARMKAWVKEKLDH